MIVGRHGKHSVNYMPPREPKGYRKQTSGNRIPVCATNKARLLWQKGKSKEGTNVKSFLLNMPNEIHHKLESSSKAHKKPMTQIILASIEAYLTDLEKKAEKYLKNTEKKDDPKASAKGNA